MEVKCPRCAKPTAYSATNPYRPFCSERCKLIDLGQWADEKYAIPVESDSFADLPESATIESDDSGHEPSSEPPRSPPRTRGF
jgi:endogenous inhibitor of DNA gyrase (YacG/DUF329 family)